MIFFLDTETIGLTSPLLTIQYAEGILGEKVFWPVWDKPVKETLALLERFCTGTVIAWNLVFDWFQVVKWYNIFREFADLYPDSEKPNVDLVWEIEQTTPRKFCLKPQSAVDLMIVARKGKYQHLMKFKPVIIRRVPQIIAEELAILIEDRLKLPDGVQIKWSLVKNDRRPEVVDLKVSFIGSTSLKYVHQVATGIPMEGYWGDFFDIKEFGAPYKPWGGYWQGDVKKFKPSVAQKKYALKDIQMLQDLYVHLRQPTADTDSILTCLVAAARWKGYSIDEAKIRKHFPLPDYSMSWNSKDQVYQYLASVMDDNEKLALVDPVTKKDTTKKDNLREIIKWKLPEDCKPECGCGNPHWIPHPAAVRAAKVLQERKNEHHRDLMRKLLKAGGLFPELKVSGTLTNRMSGGSSEESTGKKGGSINPQGIDKVKWMRECFPLKWPGEMLSGGDFKSFEISIMDAVWKDPKLHEELLLGKKMIALFGAKVFYPITYEEILLTDKEGEGGKYDRAKKGFYARAYGGQVQKLSTVFGLDKETTTQRLNLFDTSYSEIGKQAKKLAEDLTFFTENYQWKKPVEEVETILGFKRSFKLEQSFAEALYKAMMDLPEKWDSYQKEIRRNEKAQTVRWACRSALCGALFSLQGRTIRVAGNFRIQSTGAELNKMLQADLWELQPVGVQRWLVRPMNVHDEQQVAHVPELKQAIETKVKEYVKRMRAIVPLIGVDWAPDIQTWADKS